MAKLNGQCWQNIHYVPDTTQGFYEHHLLSSSQWFYGSYFIDTLQRELPNDTVNEFKSQNFHFSSTWLQNPWAFSSPELPSGYAFQIHKNLTDQRKESMMQAGGPWGGCKEYWWFRFLAPAPLVCVLDSVPLLENRSTEILNQRVLLGINGLTCVKCLEQCLAILDQYVIVVISHQTSQT